MDASHDTRWWITDGHISHLLAGVFEGGGAKGAAYAGALHATLAKHCWFGAVAGASAGAITAALIAAGLSPDEIAEESELAFEQLRPDGVLAGLERLRLNFGFLNNDGLLGWLEDKLARQVEKHGVMDVAGPVTFATLYSATGIELNVVAADLTRGCQLVFNVWNTPGAQVADAVLASSSIPFAFPSRSLAVSYGEETYSHTVVDGGVWSNFPMFVFTDRSFRRATGQCEEVAEAYVVGYLLDEEPLVVGSPDIAGSRFAKPDAEPPPREWYIDSSTDTARASSVWNKLITPVLLVALGPLWLLLRFGSWLSLGNSKAWRGRWPRPKGLVGSALRVVDDVLSELHSAWLAGVVALALLGGGLATIYWFVASFILLRIDEIRLDLVFAEGWWPVALEIVQVVLVSLVIVLILATTVLTFIALLTNYLALGTARQSLYGLVRTYAAGPGAPEWAGAAAGDHVIRLPVPRALTTLSFDRSSPAIAAAIATAIASAENATTVSLGNILESPRQGGVARPGREEVSPRSVVTTAETPKKRGGGPAFALRLSLVAVGVSVVLVAVSSVLPKPAWFRFDVNVRICREVLQDPNDACNQPIPGQIAASALFGPAANGRRTQVVLKVNGEVVERSDALISSFEGRIVGIELNKTELCGDRDCTLSVAALVDGVAVYEQEADLATNIDVYRP